MCILLATVSLPTINVILQYCTMKLVGTNFKVLREFKERAQKVIGFW